MTRKITTISNDTFLVYFRCSPVTHSCIPARYDLLLHVASIVDASGRPQNAEDEAAAVLASLHLDHPVPRGRNGPLHGHLLLGKNLTPFSSFINQERTQYLQKRFQAKKIVPTTILPPTRHFNFKSKSVQQNSEHWPFF